MSVASKTEQEAAKVALRDILAQGDTIYTIHLHRSKSGMMRVYDTYIIRNNMPFRLSWTVAAAMGWPYNTRHEGVEVGGCGFDGAFEVVSTLAHVLFGDSKALRQESL